MKIYIFALLVSYSFTVFGESNRAFLESTTFDDFCSNVIVEKEPFEAIGTVWKHIYNLRNPSFAETNEFVYLGITNPIKDVGNYTIYKVLKTNPSVKEVLIHLKKAAVDIIVSGDYLWALHQRSLSRVNLITKESVELTLSNDQDFHQADRAYDMILMKDKLYVTHGTAGLLVINKDSMALERTVNLGLIQSNGHKSLAASIVAISDSKLMIGVDNLTVPIQGSAPFNGLVEVNLFSFGNRKYPYGSGIISRQSKMNFDGKTLWINNSGILQYLNVNALQKDGAAYTNWINLTYFEGDKKFAAEPRGEFFISGKDIFTCSVRSRLMITKREPKIGIAYRIRNGGVPKELALTKLNLNVNFKWLNGPYVTDFAKSTMQVELTDNKGQSVYLPSGMTLGIYAHMPSMSHPAFDMGFFAESSKGVYLNKDIMLGMSGDWVIELQVYDQKLDLVDSIVLEEFK